MIEVLDLMPFVVLSLNGPHEISNDFYHASGVILSHPPGPTTRRREPAGTVSIEHELAPEIPSLSWTARHPVDVKSRFRQTEFTHCRRGMCFDMPHDGSIAA